MARSRNAVGALEVAQAGNELAGLSVKQSLQLQSLLAAQHRAETFAKSPRSRHRGRSAPALQVLRRHGLGLHAPADESMRREDHCTPADYDSRQRSRPSG